jgi:hypothetical protein
VLDDQHRCGKIGRQGGKNLGQRQEATRRGAQTDDRDGGSADVLAEIRACVDGLLRALEKTVLAGGGRVVHEDLCFKKSILPKTSRLGVP